MKTLSHFKVEAIITNGLHEEEVSTPKDVVRSTVAKAMNGIAFNSAHDFLKRWTDFKHNTTSIKGNPKVTLKLQESISGDSKPQFISFLELCSWLAELFFNGRHENAYYVKSFCISNMGSRGTAFNKTPVHDEFALPLQLALMVSQILSLI